MLIGFLFHSNQPKKHGDSIQVMNKWNVYMRGPYDDGKDQA